MINKNFSSKTELLKTFSEEKTCIEHLEILRWDGYIISPFDSSSKVYKCKNNNYRCKNTGKYFNVKTNTLFDNTKIDLRKWFLAIWLIIFQNESMTSVQLSKELSITQKTAWVMLQRIRRCFDIEDNAN